MNKQHFTYTAFGVVFESVFEIPELIPVDEQKSDVKIVYGEVPEHLPDVRSSGVLYEAAPGDFIFRLDTVGAYRVEKGNQITVSPNPDVPASDIRVFLLTAAFAALFHQKGYLPLHASSIMTNKGAVLFCGASAAGKSSLAAAFKKRGYKIIADDVALVTRDKHSGYIVHPGIPALKLWKDVLDHLEDMEEYIPVRQPLQKFYKPVKDTFADEPVSVSDIVVLASKNTPGFEINEIKGVDKFEKISANTYRIRYVDGLEKQQDHFMVASGLAGQVKLFDLKRPTEPLLIDELANYIEKKLEFSHD